MYRTILAITTLIPAVLFGNVSLPEIFSDNMVLQQGKTVRIWGTADPNERVTVKGSWNHQPVATVAEDGKWSLELPLPPAGGPFTLSVQGKNSLNYKNVMVGEVWLCSGQSNMEWGINCFSDTQEDRSNACHPHIRLFMVNRSLSTTPKTQFGNNEKWQTCTPDSISEGGFNGFSATAFYFARHLQKALQVPIGVIQTAWGGTIAEAWTPKQSLKKLGGYQKLIKQVEKLELTESQINKINHDRLAAWYEKVKKSDPGLSNNWQTSAETGSWTTTSLPGLWTGKLKNYDGIVWYKKNITIPEQWRGKPLIIKLTAIDDEDITWFNSTKLGETKAWNQPRQYTVPAAVTNVETATITVRVYDLIGNGGFIGSSECMKIYPKHQVEQAVSLAGEWLYKETVAASDIPKKPELIKLHRNMASVLYNGMVTPLLPLNFRGAIWYQGESNASNATSYQALFTEMVTAWRRHFQNGEFPFYYVQIAPFNYRSKQLNAVGVQEAQRRALATIKNSGMVVTNDIGNINNIHPNNKSEVGRRLTLWALNKTYGRTKLPYSGPLFKTVTIAGNKLICHFDYSEGLHAPEGLNSFQIAGADGHFFKANAEIINNTVVLSSPHVPNPKNANYAWSNTAEAELFNKYGLPASTFNTLWNK